MRLAVTGFIYGAVVGAVFLGTYVASFERKTEKLAQDWNNRRAKGRAARALATGKLTLIQGGLS